MSRPTPNLHERRALGCGQIQEYQIKRFFPDGCVGTCLSFCARTSTQESIIIMKICLCRIYLGLGRRLSCQTFHHLNAHDKGFFHLNSSCMTFDNILSHLQSPSLNARSLCNLADMLLLGSLLQVDVQVHHLNQQLFHPQLLADMFLETVWRQLDLVPTRCRDDVRFNDKVLHSLVKVYSLECPPYLAHPLPLLLSDTPARMCADFFRPTLLGARNSDLTCC